MCKDPRVITAYEKEQTDKMVYYTSLENATNKGKFLGFIEGKTLGIEEGKSIGIEEGKSIGIEEGKTIGIIEGETIGIKKSKIDIAKKLLEENASFELITKVTGISKIELEKMKNK